MTGTYVSCLTVVARDLCYHASTLLVYSPVYSMTPATDPNGSQTIYQKVQSQFGPVAAAYTTSVGHSDPDQLAVVVHLAAPQWTDLALDIATGAGHTALALAPHVQEVIAYDLTPAMLEETQRNAQNKGITNLRTQQGSAEQLPFADSHFEIVTVRVAPHHFADIRAAVQEMARVVKPGGRVVVVDTTVPEDEDLDQQINEIEQLRDPSHVRDYRPSEWRGLLEDAGLQISRLTVDYYTEGGHMDFLTWTGRMRTPADVVADLETRFRQASPELIQALDIRLEEEAIRFCLPKVTIAARKP